MSNSEWVGYEFRRIGKIGLMTPLLIVAGFGIVAVPMALLGREKGQIANLLSSVPEVYLPIAAGLAAAAIVAREPALDLHLTLRTHYRTTALRRLALLVGWTALASVLWASVLQILGLWTWPEPFLVAQLGWLVPLLWFVSAAALLALLLRSQVASGAILGAVWLFQNLLGGLMLTLDWLRPFYLFGMDSYSPQAEAWFDERYWLDSWLTLGIMALAMALCTVLVLSKSEFLASGGDA